MTNENNTDKKVFILLITNIYTHNELKKHYTNFSFENNRIGILK